MDSRIAEADRRLLNCVTQEGGELLPTMPERGTIFSLQAHKRAQFSLVEVYKRGGKGTKGLVRNKQWGGGGGEGVGILNLG